MDGSWVCHCIGHQPLEGREGVSRQGISSTIVYTRDMATMSHRARKNDRHRIRYMALSILLLPELTIATTAHLQHTVKPLHKGPHTAAAKTFQFCILLVWSVNGDAPFQGKFQVNLLNDDTYRWNCVTSSYGLLE